MVRFGNRARILALPLLVATSRCASADSILEKMQDEVSAVASQCRPATVSIEEDWSSRFQGRPNTPPAGQTNAAPKPDDQQHSGKRGFDAPRMGSGFSLGDGYVVTTADVLMGMSKPMVVLDDGRRARADIVGIDHEMNIGLLKLVSKEYLPSLAVGDSNRAVPGHFAIVMSYQLGHVSTVTLAMVAGTRTDGIFAADHFYPDLIQVAGTVGAGTSGAPVLNARGEVIGIIAGVPIGEWPDFGAVGFMRPGPPGHDEHRDNFNNPSVHKHPEDMPASAKSPGTDKTASEPHSNPHSQPFALPISNSSYVIPMNDILIVVRSLKAGTPLHCWLGLDMSDERKRDEKDGVLSVTRIILVKTVYPDSPASHAGLQPGDRLLTINGRPISRLSMIKAAVMRQQPGDRVEIVINRNGGEQKMSVKLAGRPDQIKASFSGRQQ